MTHISIFYTRRTNTVIAHLTTIRPFTITPHARLLLPQKYTSSTSKQFSTSHFTKRYIGIHGATYSKCNIEEARFERRVLIQRYKIPTIITATPLTNSYSWPSLHVFMFQDHQQIQRFWRLDNDSTTFIPRAVWLRAIICTRLAAR